MTTFQAINENMFNLSDQELRDLNRTIVEQLRLRRKLEIAKAAVNIRVGHQYILKNVRPSWLIGKQVEVVLIKRSKALVKYTVTGRNLGEVAFSCLEPIEAA